MKYSDCYKNKTLKMSILCLGHNEDKSVTFISICFKYKDKMVQVGFCPYMTKALEEQELEFIGQYSPNLESLKWQREEYEKICQKKGLKDTGCTCSFEKLVGMVLDIIDKDGERFLHEFGYLLQLLTPFGDWDSGKEVRTVLYE